MKIIILGNGFDLANGFKTRYKDFFEDPEIFKVEKNYVKNLQNIVQNKSEETHLKEDCFDNYDFEVKEINIWKLYFTIRKGENNCDESWSYIESQIYDFLLSISGIYSHFSGVYFPNRIINNKVKYPLNELSLLYFLITILYKQEDIYNILMKHLIKLEKDFSDYVLMEMYNCFESDNNYRKYRKNIIKIANSKDKSLHIINFNFSLLSFVKRRDGKNFDIKNHIEINYGKDTFNITEINVHGNVFNTVIFGFDQSLTEKFDNDDYFSFTKTYRKLKLCNDSYKVIPSREVIEEIIFFGHSLSEPDYSYFKLLFDTYDLANSRLVLNFKYIIYDDNKRDEIERNYYKSIKRLIFTYNRELSNDGIKNNLMNKLIIEGRLKINEVRLMGNGIINGSGE